jgi:hypothetical protein
MTELGRTEIIEFDTPTGAGDAWSAIIGGAVAASAISLVLLVLGAGLGLGAISPWVSAGSAPVAVGALIWLIVVQWIAAAGGGYLTGRMRARAEPSDEVFFRDTANGFLAWGVATLLAAAVLASASTAVVNTTARVAAGGAATVAYAATQAPSSAADSDPEAYYADMLLRPMPGPQTEATTISGAAPNLQPSQGVVTPDLRAEVGRVLTHGLSQPEFPPTDLTYLGGLLSARTGLAADAAKTRVDNVVAAYREAVTKAQSAAAAAQRAASRLAIFMCLSLIVGAFIASAAAALGGVHRDETPVKLRG